MTLCAAPVGSQSLAPRFEGLAPQKTQTFELARCHRLGWKELPIPRRKRKVWIGAVTSECFTERVGPWTRPMPQGSQAPEPQEDATPADLLQLWGLLLTSPWSRA